MLELCEAGGKLALQPQGGALPDEIGVNFRVRPVIVSDMTCKGNSTPLPLLPSLDFLDLRSDKLPSCGVQETGQSFTRASITPRTSV